MTPTPVGMRCPECMRQRTKVVRGVGQQGAGFWRSPATFVLVGVNVAVYLIEIAGGGGGLNSISPTIYFNYALHGTAVAEGEWYRLVTGAFLHYDITHILFNMVALFFLGRLVEPALGTPRFLALYFASLLAGSFGALVFSGAAAFTVGASGAIFGLFSAAFVIAWGRGLGLIAREIGFLLVINLVFTLSVPGISIGGHVGGLVGGAICALAIVAGERGALGPRHRQAEFAVMALVAIISVLGALAVA